MRYTRYAIYLSTQDHNLKEIQDKIAIADNVAKQAQYSRALFIWTDCDREGEYIGAEVRRAALQGNRQLEVKRAQFSNTERAYANLSTFTTESVLFH